ncbi:unnamed protein product [Pedinophyceae sp. YPF-701]|nr:unnamed protein product [Pedinophyceae sp. YPF-701]
MRAQCMLHSGVAAPRIVRAVLARREGPGAGAARRGGQGRPLRAREVRVRAEQDLRRRSGARREPRVRRGARGGEGAGACSSASSALRERAGGRLRLVCVRRECRAPRDGAPEELHGPGALRAGGNHIAYGVRASAAEERAAPARGVPGSGGGNSTSRPGRARRRSDRG